MASRPKTLLASISPVALGTSFALYFEYFRLIPACLALTTSVFIQILANYVNDHYDFLKGADTEERIGPPRVLQSSLLSPQSMEKAILVVALICVFLGGILVYLTDHIVLLIGIFSLIFAFLYTAGPYPLAYHGLGEVFVILFFGPISVLGSHYVHSLEYEPSLLMISFAPGLLASLILMTNNIRDMKTDRSSQKNTLVVLLGLKLSRILYTLISLTALLIPLLYVQSMGFSILIFLFILPLIVRSNLSIYRYEDPKELNGILVINAVALLLFCLLFSVGMFL